MNRPKALNALSVEMLSIMLNELKQMHINLDYLPKVVIVSGNGGKAFCAGGDIMSLFRSGYAT